MVLDLSLHGEWGHPTMGYAAQTEGRARGDESTPLARKSKCG